MSKGLIKFFASLNQKWLSNYSLWNLFFSELIDKNNFSETNEDLKRFFPALKGEIPRLYHMQELMISRVLAEKIITRGSIDYFLKIWSDKIQNIK